MIECKFKIGNYVITNSKYSISKKCYGFVTDIKWVGGEFSGYWRIYICTQNGVLSFAQDYLKLNVECYYEDFDKKLKSPEYMSEEMKFLKTKNDKQCVQIYNLIKENKELIENLKCEQKYNNSIKEEYRMQNSCYKKTINFLETRVEKLNVKTNHILYYLIFLTVFVTIICIKIIGVI